MPFEFDPYKSRSNKAKHRIDFEEVQAFSDDENAVVVEFAFRGERRFGCIARIARFGSQTWTI
ncbi:MAG TPA: BrnT family toxin, partial [Chthoniobacterales bacterium]|nr:BrnT family toxin [Chthoniobacterales bacterium]